MEQQELDLREIFQVIRRRIWMILLMPLVAGLVAALLSLFVLKPVYSASTTLWVIKDGSQIDYSQLLLARNLTKTYAQIGQSRAVLEDVIERLNLRDITVQDLQEKVTVSAVRDTELISLMVEDTDPEMAVRLADTLAAAFQDRVRAIMQVENVAVVDSAEGSVEQVRPRPVLNTAIAVVLGGMVAVGLAFLLEFLDTSVKSPEDVARHIGLPVLGVIPVIEGAEGAAEPRSKRSSRRAAAKTKTVVE